MNPIRRLLAVIHYHQPAQHQPKASPMPQNIHKVELVTAGRGWLLHEGRWIEVTAGHLLWQGPGDPTIGRSDPENPYRCLAASFEMAARTPRPVARISEWSNLEAVHAFTAEAVRHFVDHAFPRPVLCEYLYQTFIFRAEQSRLQSHTDPMPEPLRRALAEIDLHFSRKLTLAALSHISGWSIAHLSEICRFHLKKSLHQIVIARRLRAAREQLVGTDKPIKAIALDCGFSHAAAFCEAFRSELNMTPGGYRQQFQTGMTPENYARLNKSA